MRQNGPVELIGTSRSITELKAEIERVARSDAKVLITGESGAGKEVVARAINAASPRANQPFVPVNCAGIPETLLESELFGHVKGSFTGAYRDKPGKLEMSDNGTIFLDEIGEMTLRMQGLLLRFLETGEIQKVGAERVANVTNVRVITATNRNLRDLITQGQFREDLFYRINVIHIVVPPLRERRDDVPQLVQHFLERFVNRPLNGHVNGNGSGEHSVVKGISPEAVAALAEYSWPGNVRQLENVVERLVVTGRHEIIQLDDLSPDIRVPGQFSMRPRRERRRTVADELFKKLREDRESFWTAVYPLYMNREITRSNMRDLVHKGLEEARGNYKIVLRLFNMESTDYKRFLNFLRKHDCQLPFKEYR
ncbi:MAG TPA: sigma-54 dependent transcriptional regulator [Vicinamibacterales bacterium]|jgi:transcriptional regulator with PAS, ATPase and Fis domain|nr:sigma-54 dependent transcriptional regulator [Vicinamibacterales bacterium]